MGGENDAAGCGALDGVLDQVEKYLAQPAGVAAEQCRDFFVNSIFQGKMAGIGFGAHNVHRGTNALGEGEIGLFELEAAGFNAREFENVIGNVVQPIGGGADGA